jgi:hypothetical protein
MSKSDSPYPSNLRTALTCAFGRPSCQGSISNVKFARHPRLRGRFFMRSPIVPLALSIAIDVSLGWKTHSCSWSRFLLSWLFKMRFILVKLSAITVS